MSRSRQVLICDVEDLVLAMPGDALPGLQLPSVGLPSVGDMVENSFTCARSFKHGGFHDTKPPEAQHASWEPVVQTPGLFF